MTSGSSAISRSTAMSNLSGEPVVIALGAGELDHLGEERVVGRTVDRPGRVELVEEPRTGLAGDRRGDRVEAGLHLLGDRVGLVAATDRVADQPDVLEDRIDRRRVDDDDRQAEVAQPLDVVGRRAEVAAGEHDVGIELDDLLDVDLDLGAVEGLDVGDRRRLGRIEEEVAALADDPVADAEREQGLGRGRRERDDRVGLLGDLDRRSFVVGDASAGTTAAAADGDDDVAGVPVAAGRDRAGGVGRDRRGLARAAGAGGEKRDDDGEHDREAGPAQPAGGGHGFHGSLQAGSGEARGVPGITNPSLHRSKEGSQPVGRMVPALSREGEHRPRGRRPDLRREKRRSP